MLKQQMNVLKQQKNVLRNVKIVKTGDECAEHRKDAVTSDKMFY